MDRIKFYLSKMFYAANNVKIQQANITESGNSKKKSQTLNYNKKVFNNYQSKINDIANKSIVEVNFQVVDKGGVEPIKKMIAKFADVTKEEAISLIEYQFLNKNTEITIIKVELIKSGYYEQKDESTKNGRSKRRTNSKGKGSQEKTEILLPEE